MSIEVPLYRQEKANTCALACLRMVLAAYGTEVSEDELEAQTRMEARGTPIAELQRLARRHQLVAEIREATVDDLRRLLAEGKLPIADIDRAVFALTPRQRARHSIRDAMIPTVVPMRISSNFVWLRDPLTRVSRRTIRRFRQAHGMLGNPCVVCSRSAEQPTDG